VSEDRRYDLKALMKEFKLTEQQVRYRLLKLQPVFDRIEYVPKRGQQNKILLSDEGMRIFRQLVTLEQKGHLVKDGVRVLLSELPRGEAPSRRRAYERQIEELKEEIEFLRRQNEDLRAMLRELVGKAASGLSDERSDVATKEEPPTT
jgi:hypothetical protein